MAHAKEKCSVCPEVGELEYITVRVYRRRSQTEFRYRVCRDCQRVLAAFLEGGAIAIQRGIFSQNEDLQLEADRRRYRSGTARRRTEGVS